MPFQIKGNISRTMPKSQIVPVPRPALADPVICIPAPGKPVSKLSGSWACQEARRIVLDHVAKRQSRPIAASSPKSPPLGTQKLISPPARRSPRVAVPVTKGSTWQCVSCSYEQDYVPGSRTCVMCHSTRRRSHSHQVLWKSSIVLRTRVTRYNCTNCRLAERCKQCLLARRQKIIDDHYALLNANDKLK